MSMLTENNIYIYILIVYTILYVYIQWYVVHTCTTYVMYSYMILIRDMSCSIELTVYFCSSHSHEHWLNNYY